ncbi:bifunctional DNA primase/polymerase [Nocardioides deserti]|uniref:Bifunctional DNA primase/polymerase n=1 Tax=Nocardioides deserti TaxID=1588644 RepID=A0ABR6UAC9_9ACTN|nr:bifunctional DNA primase/polymerase [Nocardioides deserti]MBC2961325.1 bifunctional DNA primase/polymerase [Nocardioides deserti]GGO72411.1 hypothetical protein GCM10012276_15710 [Nocardioides deserti]
MAKTNNPEVGLKKALQYAERGWHVFPMHFNKQAGDVVKMPLTKWAKGDDSQRATTDPAVIRRWWRRWPHAGVGIACGPSELLVIDVDGDYGAASLARLEETLGPLPTTRTVLTSRGRHLYFKTSEDLPTSAGSLGEGVDTRGVGGYVVAPPSLNQYTGVKYRWADKNAGLAPLPDPWASALLAAKGRGAGTGLGSVTRRISTTPGAYALAVLEDELDNVRQAHPGERNDALNSAAYYLGRFVGGGYLTVDEVTDALVRVAEMKGLAAGEAGATVASGLDAGSQEALILLQESSATAMERDIEDAVRKLRIRDAAARAFQAEKIAERHARSRNARKMSGSEFFLDLPAETPTLWGDGKRILWIDGEPLLICGDDGTGKSTIDHQLMAARLGFRDELLGYSVTPAEGIVLYLAMDRPEQARRAGNRLYPDSVDIDFRSNLAANLAVWRGPLPVDVLAGPEVLADWIHSEFGPVAEVHADSLKDVASKLSDDAVGSGINSAIQEVVSRGINWVGLHHQRKASGENRRPDSLSDVYGSRWLTAGQGSVLMLVKAGEFDKDQVEMRQLKEPSDRVPALLLEHDRSRGRTRVVEASQDPEQILRAAGEAGATALDVAAAMYAKDKSEVTGAEKKKADRLLARLVKSEEAVKRAGRKGGEGGTEPTRFFPVEDEGAP